MHYGMVMLMLMLLVTSTSPMVLPRDGRGDPAPGRSPGPPPSQQLISLEMMSSSESSPAEEDDETTNDTSSWCLNKVRLLETHQLSLHHPKFSIKPGLVAGIYYQVAIKPDETVSEVFVWTDVEGEWMGETYLHNCGPKHNGAVKVVTERVPLSWKMLNSPEINVTFNFMGRTHDGDFFQHTATFPTIAECSVELKASRGSISSTDLPSAHTCSVAFPEEKDQQDPSKRRGLLVQLTRLNVPCLQGGFVQLSGVTNRQPLRLCGKLEELSTRDRTFHFPAETRPNLRLVSSPVFSLNYTTVDYCYNETLTAENGSIVLNPTDELYCHFRVHLPYGYRIRLLLQVGEEPTTTVASRSDLDSTTNSSSCDGLLVVVSNGESDWTHCSRHITPKPNVEVESVGNVVTVHVMATGADHYPSLRFWYSAVPVPEIVGVCRFGEVAIRKYCVSAVHTLLPWTQAEAHCAKSSNGHLLSIRDEHAQFVVDSLLLKSPSFLDHDSYWIGASDLALENHYQWSDGHAFSYSNWFQGWQQHGFHYRQPNDDGFSQQDCVEVRRSFPAPAPAGGIASAFASSYLWNDLDCAAPNYFLCERLRSQDSAEDSWRTDCNRTITLTREHPRAVVSSPGFPYHYPDNIRCLTIVLAPPDYHIILDFEELVLEKEPTYDYLEITEVPGKAENATVYCGDMSDKLKLLRYASDSAKLQLLFVSDYSHHLGGFKARVSIENAKKECADENHKMFNNHCYLFVGYPKVTWQTALQICTGMKAQLASVANNEEQIFITSNLRKSLEYSTSTVFWLGGFITSSNQWAWIDEEPMEFKAWPPNDTLDNMVNKEPSPSCLGLQWVSSAHSSFSGLYWAAKTCAMTGGYVCKKPIVVSGASLDLSKTINGSDGYLTSPGHPGNYRSDLDYEIRIIGPAATRIIISFSKLDIEDQANCLYDFIELRSGSAIDAEQRWCGTWNTKTHPFNFVSTDNEAYLRFRSDYSGAASGFAATWRAIDVTGCPSQTLTAREGILSSPNYPEFLLPGLDCTTTILAAPGKRVWLELTELSLGKGANLELDVGTTIRPHFANGSVGGGNFVSLGEKLLVRLNTSTKTSGAGFRAIYRSVNSVHEERIVDLAADTNAVLYHLNYPAPPPLYVDFIQHFVAPLGFAVFLEFHKVVIVSGPSCPDGRGVIEINDNYADVNGTWWFLCPVDELELLNITPPPPIAITSYLHTLHVRQRSLSIGLHLNATIRVREDPQFKLKILRMPDETSVETCRPNPCLNGGKCLNSAIRKTCQCTSHFTGLFCALTQCELEPCLFGVCELTTNGYHCRCQAGYTGQFCDLRQRPCADNPCEGRGECSERGDAFHCLCHAWWEGPRCERKMMHIPYKPLSERMLQEPFWLGLITVFVVLGVIGLFWCAKRHFPEKLEKLLAEEADRHGRSHTSISTRPSSARDVGTGASAVLQSPSAPSACPRSLFGRLGIRKPSLLSLSSPSPACVPPVAPRTFSLDDLLRPTPRRSPSPRKKRTNSTPTAKKNVSEKKQILQQLISPSTSAPPANKVKLNELIQLKEAKDRSNDARQKTKETSFSAPEVVTEDRLEKKVTFARLLNKVSAEMSTSSEVDISKAPLTRAVSTPASPATNRSNYIDHRADSLSSSEMTISGVASTLDIPSTSKRPNRLNCPSNKHPSADSLLAMFRNMSSQANTPSPLDDSFYSNESLDVDTPVSTSSGPSESPGFGVTIEIPVVDAQKINYLQPPSIHLELPPNVNKCLSPIREVPTPLASPAVTPLLPRTGHDPKPKIESSEDDKADDDTDDGSTELLVEIHHNPDFSDDSPVLVIPLVTIEEPSPKKEVKTIPVFTFSGSPPPQKRENFCFPSVRSPTKKLLKEFEKPTSLDLPHPPPMIMVTCNASEGESDTESVKQTQLLNPTINSAGMNYLSPFSMCSRNDRTASESNLSSSGYSSMASPGPSRCGSNNPLCLSEVEDHGGTHSQPPSRRPSPLLRSPATDDQHHIRRRSDSETLSDDPLLESNDEGIGTDHLDEKLEDGESKTKENQTLLDFHVLTPVPPPRGVLKKCDNVDIMFNCPVTKSSLQLPTIVVQSDFCDKMLSPVSSRSESPLSDKTLGLGRFSPMFYSKNKSDQLPFTDSDGLYDFPSSDCPPSKHKSVQACTAPHRKRRDRRSNKTPSPTKSLPANAVAKENPSRPGPRKPSPKRRSRAQAPPSSSSSSESLTFGKNNVSIRLTAPDGTERPVRNEKLTIHPPSHEASGEDTAEEITDGLVSSQEDLPRTKKNLSRLRSIGNQIRFLRRIEMSLRRKERQASQLESDSNDEVEEEDETVACASTALLKRPPQLQELRKSSSSLSLSERHRSGKRRGMPLLGSFPIVAVSHGQTD